MERKSSKGAPLTRKSRHESLFKIDKLRFNFRRRQDGRRCSQSRNLQKKTHRRKTPRRWRISWYGTYSKEGSLFFLFAVALLILGDGYSQCIFLRVFCFFVVLRRGFLFECDSRQALKIIIRHFFVSFSSLFSSGVSCDSMFTPQFSSWAEQLPGSGTSFPFKLWKGTPPIITTTTAAIIIRVTNYSQKCVCASVAALWVWWSGNLDTRNDLTGYAWGDMIESHRPTTSRRRGMEKGSIDGRGPLRKWQSLIALVWWCVPRGKSYGYEWMSHRRTFYFWVIQKLNFIVG